MTSKRAQNRIRESAQASYGGARDETMKEFVQAYEAGFALGESGDEQWCAPYLPPSLYTRSELHTRFWLYLNYAHEAGYRDGRAKYCAEMDRIYDEVQKRVRFDTNRSGYARSPIPNTPSSKS